MLSLKQVARTRVLSYSFLHRPAAVSSAAAPHLPAATPPPPIAHTFRERDAVSAFRDWFASKNDPLLDRIYAILRSHDGESLSSVRSADAELSALGLRISERFVLEVLRYGTDVLSCLKFYDWAGRQAGFAHTRATFCAIFKILSAAQLRGLMLDFLESYKALGYENHVPQFRHTLVMGYALAGKPEIALQIFSKMRFGGSDLDGFGYHVLLNSMVEEGRFEMVEVLWKQIRERGFESEVTHSIMMKGFCRRNKLDEGEAHLRELLGRGKRLSGCIVLLLVDALCKRREFVRAMRLIDDVKETGLAPMGMAYGVWIKGLMKHGELDEALEFFKSKKETEGYVPSVYDYNVFVTRLLSENRLEELYDLLMEIQESGVPPNNVTINAALCFFCKIGMGDVARELYDLEDEFSLSPNSKTYKYLIDTLCRDGNIDGAIDVLKRSMEHGYAPDKNIFSIIGDVLCKKGKLDKLKELVMFSLEKRNRIPSSLHAKFISLLCKSNGINEGYLLHTAREGMNEITSKLTYISLIHGFCKSNRGDIAARLLNGMREKGHQPSLKLYRLVIQCLCNMENPETHFFKFLEMQVSRFKPTRGVYNFFIHGAGHAGRPDLAERVYDLMQKNQITPTAISNACLLQSYLKNKRFADALWRFTELRQTRLNKKTKLGKKMYNIMIAGLSKGDKVDIALDIFSELRGSGAFPSIQAYEYLVKALCSNGRYDTVLHIVNDLLKVNAKGLTPFIGNTLLLHAMESRWLYVTWARLGIVSNESSSPALLPLCQLIGVFSGCINVKVRVDDLEKMIEECYPSDAYTFNLLMRRVRGESMSLAYTMFKRMCAKGYKPDKFTYETMVYGFLKHGMDAEAGHWLQEMLRKGFEPTYRVQQIIRSRGHRAAARRRQLKDSQFYKLKK